MNITAVLLCEGKLLDAKNRLDALLQSLDLKVITNDTESKSILPSYLINMLVYLLLKTSKYSRLPPILFTNHVTRWTENFKVARHLAQNRRYLVDSDHIEPTQDSIINGK